MTFLPLLLFAMLGGEPAAELLGSGKDLTAWRASEGTPAVEAVAMSSGEALPLSLDAPFADNAKLNRVVIDRAVKLDLSAAGEFRLEIETRQPEAAGNWTLYFHSGNGWYAAGATLSKPGKQALRFPKSAFRTEEKPGGWDRVDGIRIAAWKTAAQNARFRIQGLESLTGDMAIIVPDDGAADDARVAHDVASLLAELLAELGFTADVIHESSLSRPVLGKRKVVFLPYNPRLSGEAVAVLQAYVEGGGKVFACYQTPRKLAQTLGFDDSTYVRQQRPDYFAEMRFDTRGILGMPAAVSQASWNIIDLKPAGHGAQIGARIVGRWFDGAGKPTGHAALGLSNRGAILSHILLSDDREGKRRMLAAVLGAWDPAAWKTMVRSTLNEMDHVGHCRSFEKLSEFVVAGSGDSSLKLLRSAAEKRERVFAVLQSQKPLTAADIALADDARRQAVEAYLRVMPSPQREARAVWNHSGTGAYPGDWMRSIRLLKDNGFNMVLPNMLWGGVAHYDSALLPKSETFTKYGDQVFDCCEAAINSDIEVHVWKVNYNLTTAPKGFVERMRREGRLQRSVKGESLDWLCPSHPENQKLELESMLEVARKYPIDGLHLDYIRYPGAESCYCDGCRQRFEATSGQKVADWPKECFSGPRKEAYRDWRCQQITRLVAAVAGEGRKRRPHLKISAAVFGSYPDCRVSVGQDWPAWVKAGYLDFVCPMDYTRDDEEFGRWIESQQRLIGGRIPLFPGIGATASRSALSADRVASQIHATRTLGADGFVIFNFDRDTAESIIPAVGLGAGRNTARVPLARP